MFDASDLTRFANRLEGAATSIDRSLDREGDQWGERLAGAMRGHAARDTGELAASIRHLGKGVVEVGAEHGVYQEYGTARHGPQPMAQPGLREVKVGYSRAALKTAIEELGR